MSAIVYGMRGTTSAPACLALALILCLGACGSDGGATDRDGAASEDAAGSDITASDAGASTDVAIPTDAAASAPFSIVVLPDTQYYAMSWPDIFDDQTK